MRIDITDKPGERAVLSVTITLDNDDRAAEPRLTRRLDHAATMDAHTILTTLALMWELGERRKKEFAAALRDAAVAKMRENEMLERIETLERMVPKEEEE